MAEPSSYTLAEAQLHFAKNLNGKVWELFGKADRSKAEDELMIHAAHASCYHWLMAGTELHHQRAEWLISHVYAERGIVDSAYRHASRCLELTNAFPDLMMDFDKAYAMEGMARVHALAGHRDLALQFLETAEESGRAIGNAEDRNIFLGDLNGGNWHGLR